MMMLATHLLSVLEADAHFATGWALRHALDDMPRTAAPAVDVRVLSAMTRQDDMQTVQLVASIGVAIIVPRGSDAAQQCSDALTAAIGALHSLSVKSDEVGNWTPLKLQTIEAYEPDGNLAGVELVFQAARRYRGVPCA